LTAPPKLDLSALAEHEIRVQAGEPVKIDVRVSGVPTPSVVWWKDEELESSQRVCTDILLSHMCEDFTVIHILRLLDRHAPPL